MGLGKTVQVISLIAALLGKSGTGADLEELKRRQRFARQKVVSAQRLEEEAIDRGQLVVSERKDTAVVLPEWAPILIVIPPSIIDNWKQDFGMWGHYGVAIYQGSEREEALNKIKSGEAEVLLCAKSLFTGDAAFQVLACKDSGIKWKLIIVDEFHGFKNVDGKLAINLRTLRDQCNSVVIGLTGTLMQNNHAELW